jgi:hypothetical protein
MPKLTTAQILADPTRHGHYGGRRKDGEPCGKAVVPGTQTCTAHGGKKATRLKAQGAVVVELRNWGLDDTTQDPGEVLLRLVTQSANRVELYSRLLRQAFEAAERLQAAHRVDDVRLSRPLADDEEDPEIQAAYADMRRIFATGGVGALVGVTLSDTKEGKIYASGEAIRGLAKLEADERDRCANFAAKAIAAGIAERMVRLAERQGALMAQLVVRVAERLGLTTEQQAALPAAIEAEVINMTEGQAA